MKGFIDRNAYHNQGLWVHVYVCVLAYIILSPIVYSEYEILLLTAKWWFCMACMITYECKQVIVGVVKYKTFSKFVVEVYGGFWNWFNDSLGDVLIPATLITLAEVLR